MIVRSLLLLACCLPNCEAQLNYPPELPGSKAFVYKTIGDVELKMWVYSPTDVQPQNDSRPAIVFLFGGGWKSGTPAQFAAHCQYLASRGMVAATADYRVATRHGVKADACVEDAKSAVRWLRQHAGEFGVDPHRIAAGGGSAGGHTACCTALISGLDAVNEDKSVSSIPDALALFNPAVMLAELNGFGDGEITTEKIADIATRTGVPAEQISPIHHVRKGLPPSILFHGTADTAVPFATVAEFCKRMTAAGNRCELKQYDGASHGFFNAPKGGRPERIDLADHYFRRTVLQLDQFLQSLGWLTGPATVRAVGHDFVSLRGHLQNSLRQFAVKKKGHVAFLGGSITEMNGYRPRIMGWLQDRFPDTSFTFTNAGISSTCSTTGAFRLQRDILSHGPLDLLFVEFAVNDDQDAAHSAKNCVRGMEGIIRQTRRHNPHADIVMTHFVNPGMLQTLDSKKTILSAEQHESVARHYQVSSVYLSKVVHNRIANGSMTWKEFGGTHPGPQGNQLAADMAVSILEADWSGRQPQNLESRVHESPDLLLPDSYQYGHLLPSDRIQIVNDWKYAEPDWKQIPGSKRSRYLGRPLFHADQPGASMTFSFRGTACGAFVVAGPDAGQLEFRIDGGSWQSVDLFHRYSKGLHYPRTVMFATDLAADDHTAEVRVADASNDRGTAARVLNFVVNGPSQD